MNREYHKLETPFGRVWLYPTDSKHIYISGGTDLNVEKEYPEGSRMGPVTINRVEYALHGHAHLWEDNKFHWGQEGSKDSQWRGPYMSRVDWLSTGYNSSSPTPAAKKKIREVLVPLVQKWVENHRDILLQAQARKDQQDRETKCEEIRELEKTLYISRKELEALGGESAEAEPVDSIGE